MAPSITDIFEVYGATDKIVATTGLEEYKPIVVGSFLNLDLETIIKINPTIVFLTKDYFDYYEFFTNHNIKYEILNFNSINEVNSSFKKVSNICKFKNQNNSDLILNNKNKKILFTLADSKLKSLDTIYLLGSDGIYPEIIEFSGNLSIYNGQTKSLDQIGYEELTQLKPDYIFELSTSKIDHTIYQPFFKSKIIQLPYSWATSPTNYIKVVKFINEHINEN